MKLVDNRYKVNKLVKDTNYYTIYEVVDLWDSDRKLLMKVYITEKQSKVIDYFINNFISMSRIKHPYLLSCKQFSIMKSIDGKMLKFKQYYSTAELLDAPCLEDIYNDLSLKEKIQTILKVCSILDYLHYKGIVYKLLSPTHIFVDDAINIKLMDIASIYERIANVDYDNIARFFIAPEVLLQNEDNISPSADKYSLGMLMAYLLTDNFYKDKQVPYTYKPRLKLTKDQIDFLNQVISILTNKNPFVRDIRIHDLIEDIINVFDIDYKYDLVKERGTLDFETTIIGRDKELQRIMDYDAQILKENKYGNSFTKMFLICGDEGVGKSRLLKEVAYRLRMRGREVYSLEINDSNNSNLMPISEILRQTFKNTPKNIYEKYAKEFIGILPELELKIGKNLTNNISDQRNRLRLYDRITKYFEDFTSSKEDTVYLIIDNIEETSIDFLFLIDYLLHRITYGNVELIVSFNEKRASKFSDKYDIFTRWMENNYIETIKIGNFNLDEIGQFVRQILGINYRPVKFSAVLLKECRGNPKYMEYMIRDLYAKGDLYFAEEGFWEVKNKSFSGVGFPSSLDDALINQLKKTKREHMYIMKILSASQFSVAKAVLYKMANMDQEELDKVLEELVTMRLVDEAFSDWGFSYSIFNVELKKYIYNRISESEKVEIHTKLAQLLEDNYSNSHETMMDELIHQLVSSNKREKAISLLVDLANKQSSIYGSKSLLLWETAYEICKNTDLVHIFSILESLGQIYFVRGKNDEALKIYSELYEKALKSNQMKYCIIANLGIAEIYYQKGLSDKALEKTKETIELAEKIECLRGIAESRLLYCKILCFSSKFETLYTRLDETKEFVLKHNIRETFGKLYNLIGLYHYYNGNTMEAIKNFQKSYQYFVEHGQVIDSTRPLNNIAIINFDNGLYDEAMQYYKAALDIADKHEVLNLKIVYLNNIGEVYMNKCEYEKAKNYFEESGEIAALVDDIRGIILANINLGLIYLNTCRYNKAYDCYKALEEYYPKYKDVSVDLETQYFNFLGSFYLFFGKWDEAKKWNFKAMKQFHQYDNVSGYLAAKFKLALTDYFSKRTFDKEQLEEIRKELKSKKINYIRRKALLYLGIISLLEEDYGYLKDILAEDEEMKEYSTKNFDYIREMLEYAVTDDKKSRTDLIILEEKLKQYNFLDSAMIVSLLLAFRAYERGNYFQSFNYYVEALDLIYTLIKDVSVRELQISFIKARRSDFIKDKLAKVILEVFGEEINWTRIDELKDKDSIERYFDYSSLLELMDKVQYSKLVANSVLYRDIVYVMDIPALINELTDDYRYNLEFILKFLCKETLAQRGYILVYEESKNEYIPLIQFPQEANRRANQNLLALANRYEEGILLSTSMESNIIGLYKELLPKNTKALICVPIKVKGKKVKVDKERRKNNDNTQASDGFILLETNRLFNRFDQKSILLIRNLTNIVHFNIENYKLRSLSTIDRLTGTYTRKYFENELTKRINESKMNHKSFAVVMGDIDNFKAVNDTYGHNVGDIVLSKIGRHIMDNVRKTDVVARYGGEEFVILLNNVTEEQAIRVADNLREGISKLNIHSIDNSITISLGVSMFPKHSQFKEELIIKADQALYSAKEKGKNRVVMWNPNLSNALNRLDKLAGILTGNINNDQANVLALLDTIGIVKENISKDKKIFSFLGKVIEALQAEYCTLIELGEKGKVLSNYSRKRLNKHWTDNTNINYEIVKRVIASKRGEFLIDWDIGNEALMNQKIPNWQSVIVLPLMKNNHIKGVGYMTVPIKEKEFDYNSYNLAKALWDIFSTIM